MKTAVVSFRVVTKTFGELTAVEDVSFDVPAGRSPALPVHVRPAFPAGFWQGPSKG